MFKAILFQIMMAQHIIMMVMVNKTMMINNSHFGQTPVIIVMEEEAGLAIPGVYVTFLTQNLSRKKPKRPKDDEGGGEAGRPSLASHIGSGYLPERLYSPNL